MDDSYSKIIENIKITSEESSGFLQREVEKFLRLIKDDFEKLTEIANSYRRQIEESKLYWEKVKSEIKTLEENRENLKRRGEELDLKATKLAENETNLMELHKILENRKKLLDAREQELETKGRRIG